MQSEKNNSQQSLFGGSDTVEIQKPTIPAAHEWTKLELLNKERDVIGMYLSSHPLDDYKVIINNFCTMQLSALENLAENKNKDFIVAGMITAVQNLLTKTGKPFGRFTLEDYNGSYQFALFGKDYENFRKFLYPDYYLLIRGKVAPRPYNDKEFEPRIASIMQLSEARETLIKEMTLTLPVKEITAEVVQDLSEIVKNSTGNILFRVKVTDPVNEISLGLYSRTFRINLSSELVRFCEAGDYKFTLI